MHILNRQQVAELGGNDPIKALQDVEDTVRLLRSGDAIMPAETHVDLDTPLGKVYALPARVGGRFNATGVKWTAHRPRAADGYPQAMATTLLNRADNGLPVGLLESGGLTATRTAAVSALALKLASPCRPSRVLLLGAGIQARAHLEMLAAHFPDLEMVYFWNKTPEPLAGMLSHSGELPWPVTQFETLNDALRQHWDALITCTSASEPFLRPGIWRAGTIVLQIGYHEVAFDTIAAADKVVVDLWGDFKLTSAKSLFQMYRAGLFDEKNVAADLAALLVDGWRPAETDRVYFSSFGLNVFDIALAARVLQNAVEQGQGSNLPFGWESGNAD
ncbi:alanine dehydrogenase [Cedecea lapagei]|uniref:Alanine dehydrogenase n=1 Tax=Cedecea lapagei TaxID=158823 RepID=A0A3S4MFE8_9ENTR|nr:ornithine cyclodeaminase family protein [Cedecea lapagei]VEB97532.1 alanine dehydrogenase [Cedecea lapagei]